MKVEIYTKEETAEGKELNDWNIMLDAQIERLDERIMQCEKAGLRAQAHILQTTKSGLLVKKRGGLAAAGRKALTTKQMEVLRDFFNCEQDVRDFYTEIIPASVVEEYSKVASNFTFMSVFYHEKPGKDPLLVGRLGDDLYLISRWGDGLRPWEWFVRRHILVRANEFGIATFVIGGIALAVGTAIRLLTGKLELSIVGGFILMLGSLCLTPSLLKYLFLLRKSPFKGAKGVVGETGED